MATIKEIHAREILNAKGNPAVEAIVILSDGTTAICSSPSGTSIGTYEAVDLHDKDEKRFAGMGVLRAVENIEKLIGPKIVGMDASDQAKIDQTMIDLDGTPNKAKLGANAILAVSMSVCKAAAKSSALPLFTYIRHFIQNKSLPLSVPTPLFNLINGGVHADKSVDIQEFFIIPASSKPFSEALQNGLAIYRTLHKLLSQNNLSTLIGDEGGFGPKLVSNKDAFVLLKQSVDESNLRFGFDVFFGIDAASNSFFTDKQYRLRDKPIPLSALELTNFYSEIHGVYPLLYLEDGMAEDDWEGWAELSQKLGGKVMLVGDDLTVTNPYRLQLAVDKKIIGGIIIKPNQIGSIIETLAVVEMARAAGLKIIVSHRSGETNDDFIADFAVGVGADYVKFGAPIRGERVAKYNRLLQIEKDLVVNQSK